MRFARRRFLQLSITSVAAHTLSGAAAAVDYPVRPLRWIVGFSAGGGTDTVSRIMAQWLSQRLGQPVVIENKPGASSNIAIQAALTAPPDGYTVVTLTSSAAINVTLFDNLPFNLLRDVVPVAGIIDFPLVLVVHPSVPAANVAEFIAYAKGHPGEITMASYGTGSTSHLALELFQTMAGVRMVHVPYRGDALALADTVSGHVQGTFATLTAALPHIKAGAVRLLAVAGRDRNEFVPDAPTIGETVPGYEAYSWAALGAPRGTPAEIVTRLNREINAGLAAPAMRERLAAAGTTPMVHTPETFGAFLAGEVEKWSRVIRTAGIKPE
jgi:tripartite-type tricarboxylate transporter receptor subunit TctC